MTRIRAASVAGSSPAQVRRIAVSSGSAMSATSRMSSLVAGGRALSQLTLMWRPV